MVVSDEEAAARIAAFARGHGCAHVWDYLLAHPGVPIDELANAVGDVSGAQLLARLVAECRARRQMGELVRDLVARSLRRRLPRGWGQYSDNQRVAAVIALLPRPYMSLTMRMRDELRAHPPPDDWVPASGADELLRRAYDGALASLSEERRAIVARGEIEPADGDLYYSKLAPLLKTIRLAAPETFLDDFARAPAPLGHLFAAHVCHAEVVNGGFQQLFINVTGVVAPEAVGGFDAIGMRGCADVIVEAMRFFGGPYPRDRDARGDAISAHFDASQDGRDPFRELDRRFHQLSRSEAGGFEVAADRYCQATVK